MRVTIRDWDDRVGQWPADHLLACPPERSLCLGIPGDDATIRSHANECVVRRIHHNSREFLAVGQSSKSCPAAFVGGNDDDQVGHRESEVPLVSAPMANATDVLQAQDSNGEFVLIQRHVEHSSDSASPEIVGGELPRPLVGVCVISGDKPISLKGVKVMWIMAAKK